MYDTGKFIDTENCYPEDDYKDSKRLFFSEFNRDIPRSVIADII